MKNNLETEIRLYQLRNPIINHQENSLNDYMRRVATYFSEWQKKQQTGLKKVN